MKIKNVTFNIRCIYGGDGINNFPNRFKLIEKRIEQEQPDFICFQEITAPHKRDLAERFPDYEFYGIYRGSDLRGEGVKVAVRKGRFWVLEVRSFWLSPTPRVPASRFPEDQSACPRICCAVTLEDRETGTRFRVYCVHTDHVGPIARLRAAELILDEIAKDNEMCPMPCFVEGDFNAVPDTPEIAAFRDAGMTDLTADSGYTFHGYGDPNAFCKIDYIFASEGIKKLDMQVWKDNCDGVYLSDHYPICVTAEL